MYHLQLMKS